jgi:hypothetical protein
VFDIRDHLDDLRCRETSWLAEERERELREIRRREVRVLALTKVLDERQALGPDLAARDGVSEATSRRMVETARALESLPEVAAVAYDGRLSAEQLAPAVELADEASDAEWAQRAAEASPAALTRMAREQRKPTREESLARRNARYLRMWRDEKRGMLRGEFAVPSGAQLEAAIDGITEQMRPQPGEPWEKLERRRADALVVMAEAIASDDDRDEEDRASEPTLAPRIELHVHVPVVGPATLTGTADGPGVGADCASRSTTSTPRRGAGATTRRTSWPCARRITRS